MELIRRQDLEFLLYDWLDAESLTKRERYADHSRATFDAVLELGNRIASEEFFTHYKLSDRKEPELDREGNVHVPPEVRRAVLSYGQAGLVAASFLEEVGGQQLPHLIAAASMAHFMAASIATAAYPMLAVANARLLVAFGSQSLIEHFAKPQILGHWLGTMCLSEPQAGSSLGDITTRAIYEADDSIGHRYRLTGAKMWISGGDHDITENIIHLVLAKIPDQSGRIAIGTKSISLFVVPKILPSVIDTEGGVNDIAVAGLNHKMGYRATSNCLLKFGEGTTRRPLGRSGAIGYLIGEPGQGLTQMFQMMNEARISVGLGAAACAYRGYMLALEYAKIRTQGRIPGGVTSAPPSLLIEHADVKRMLLAQKAYAEGALALCLYCAKLVDDSQTQADHDARNQAGALLGLLTPVAKTWSSDWGLAANDLAIQVHGGYGYTRDFDVEQLYRDNRLNPIHEGTTGIQAVDLLGRKLRRDGAAAYALLKERMVRTEAAAGSTGNSQNVEALRSARLRIENAINRILLITDDRQALRHATPFLNAFGHLVVGWLWLDMTVAAAKHGDKNGFANGKLRACAYFFDFEMPKIEAWLAPIFTDSEVITNARIDEF